MGRHNRCRRENDTNITGLSYICLNVIDDWSLHLTSSAVHHKRSSEEQQQYRTDSMHLSTDVNLAPLLQQEFNDLVLEHRGHCHTRRVRYLRPKQGGPKHDGKVLRVHPVLRRKLNHSVRNKVHDYYKQYYSNISPNQRAYKFYIPRGWNIRIKKINTKNTIPYPQSALFLSESVYVDNFQTLLRV